MFPVRTMTNLETEFHEAFTRPGAKREQMITIRFSDIDRHRPPQDYKQYMNFSWLESDLKMRKSLAKCSKL